MARPSRSSAASVAAIEARPGPCWPVAALALAGLVVAAYLTWLKLTGNPAVFCGPGSGCDIVQASQYGTLLRVPTALWGGLFYVAVAGLALAGLSARRWLLAFLLAAAGAGFSLYLTAISIFVLGTTCLYCLLSAAISLALVGVLVWARPVRLVPAGRRAGAAWSRLGLQAAGAAAGAVLVGAFIFAGQGGSTAEQVALARHLSETRSVMYGAFWCPACTEQKRRFGTAASSIPYVECDGTAAGGRPDLCRQANVKVYPTWVIRGQRHEGVMTLDQLATLSDFPGLQAGTPAR
ncbi:MAG TPA: vitamin K epoxide reductase family protein [Candidatus Binatia bacterium]|nr:vitamin K epoxide reductase family protein [Candidatus Binatia bacterium]